MAHTLSIDNAATSDVDVGVPMLTQANLTLIGTDFNRNTGVNISHYVLNTSDPNYPTLVDVRTELQSGNNPQRRSSITLRTWARDVDEDAMVVALKPISIVIAINTPVMSMEMGDLSDLVANAYALTFNSLSTKVPSTALLSELQFGVTQLY